MVPERRYGGGRRSIRPTRPPGPAPTSARTRSSLGRWRASIQQVINAGGPSIMLQPIVDFAGGRIGGYEALARFGTELADAPDRWVARAHQVGMGDQLEASAVAAALTRREELEPHQFLTINLSPSSLTSAPVQDLLRRAAPLDGVIIELTEHDQIPDRPEVGDALLLVRDHGGMIAVDDIGTGYAGLERVLAVRPELVKLGAAFVTDIDRDEARATFVSAVGDLLDSLDTWLVAEGIETEGELETLVSLGVPLGQGFLLGRPAGSTTGLAPHLRDVIVRARAAFSTSPETVGRHVEHAPTFEGEVSPHLGRSVRVDPVGRPLAVCGRERLSPAIVAAMRVRASDPVESVALRALARPEAERWTPIVVTDDAGRYQGIVRMERLVRALANRKDPR